MANEIFIELAQVLIVTVGVASLMRLLKQPLIIGYIITGVLVGPFVLNIVTTTETLSAFAHIGISFLLFMVGINLNPKIIKDVGKVSLVTGIGQVIFTSFFGFILSRLMGFSVTESLYICIALTFSSTIIIMKLLSDKRGLETLYGRISIGCLIVQDFIAILMLIIIVPVPAGESIARIMIESVFRGAGALLVMFGLGVYLLPKLLTRVIGFIAKSQEYLLLFSIGWCFAVSAAFHYMNYSIEAGALLAGITLSMSPYHYEISSRMRPLRDFFLVLFFVLLGSQMVFSSLQQYIVPIIVFSFFILIGNPLIVMILMGLLGYTKRNSFMAGLTVAQISEFSLVLIALGVRLGHLDTRIMSLVTVIGLITIAGSSYMIVYSEKIYSKISKYLVIFEKKGEKVDEHRYHKGHVHDIILFGCNRTGLDILESIKRNKHKVLVVDYDPEVVQRLAMTGVDCRYGDANDSELIGELDFAKAKMVISTVPDLDTNLLLINEAKTKNKNVIIIAASGQMDEAMKMYDEGATYVLLPQLLGGHHVSTMIEENQLSFEKFLSQKIVHMENLKGRIKLGSHGKK